MLFRKRGAARLLIRETSANSGAIAGKLRNDGTPRIMLFRCYDKAGQLIFHNEPLLKGRKSWGRIGQARIGASTIACIHTERGRESEREGERERVACFLANAIVSAHHQEMPNVANSFPTV